MKPRHQGDLVWRFQVANEQLPTVPSSFAIAVRVAEGHARGGEPGACITDWQIAASERVARIDAALERMEVRPVRLARVLFHRYGGEETLPEIRLVFRDDAGIIVACPCAAKWFKRIMGKDARPRSNDIRDWMATLCRRVSTREANGVDTMVLDDIRRDAEAQLLRAEEQYEALAERRIAA
jgi:hypothetical protein